MAPFASNLGGGTAIKEAMARRGMTGGAGTTQVSPAAPTFNPQTQPPPAPMGSALPTGMTATSQPTAPQPVSMGASAMGPTNPEATLIVKALTARLASLSKPEMTTGV